MKEDSRIYISGHRGLVGSAILRRLRGLGYMNLITRTHGELDLIRQSDVEAFFAEEQPEYVFLAAAKVGGIRANMSYPAEFIYNNLAIQTNTIHSAWKTGVKGLLFLGSSCIYPKMAPQPIKEEYFLTGPLESTNEPYAIAKIAGIELCDSFNSRFNTHFLSVMPNNVYGPNDNYDLEDSHVLPALIRKFHLAKLAAQRDWEEVNRDVEYYGKIPEDTISGLKQKTGPIVRLWGSGSPKREFLYSDDLADACIFLMNRIEEIFSSVLSWPEGRHLINIGSGQEMTIRQLSNIVAQVVGFDGQVEWDSSNPDGIPQKLLDVSKLTRLGWRSKMSLEEGIRLAYQDYRDRL